VERCRLAKACRRDRPGNGAGQMRLAESNAATEGRSSRARREKSGFLWAAAARLGRWGGGAGSRFAGQVGHPRCREGLSDRAGWAWADEVSCWAPKLKNPSPVRPGSVGPVRRPRFGTFAWAAPIGAPSGFQARILRHPAPPRPYPSRGPSLRFAEHMQAPGCQLVARAAATPS